MYCSFYSIINIKSMCISVITGGDYKYYARLNETFYDKKADIIILIVESAQNLNNCVKNTFEVYAYPLDKCGKSYIINNAVSNQRFLGICVLKPTKKHCGIV